MTEYTCICLTNDNCTNIGTSLLWTPLEPLYYGQLDTIRTGQSVQITPD